MKLNHPGFFLLIAVAVLGVTGFFAYQGSAGAKSVTASNDSTAQVASVVAAVGNLILLPENETPTIAEVTDPSALSDQDFFRNAKQGDIMLVYAEAHRAYLYDPKADKILEVATVNFGQ